MVNNILYLKDRSAESHKNQFDKLGQTVFEISELYRIVRERQIDLILIDQNRTDLKYPVASKIRRYNGLTEIYKIISSVHDHSELEAYLDGYVDSDSGQDNVSTKIKKIIHVKNRLEQFHIIARSAKMKIVAETIDRIAPTDVSVLIVGPSGSGKELVSRAIHHNSMRADQPFVAVNCGAIAEGLLESELFGHEKGAFTGSVSKREGLFFKANRGTIFLDEIGETKPDMQIKMLRVLEDGTYYPVGSSDSKFTDVRVVAATNRDLTEAIAEKSFREDLYFRIGVVKIILPPLFERKGDIQPLIQHFWKDEELDYTDSAMELLESYDWPGNVRQLKNFADRMKAFKQKGLIDKIDVERFIDEQHGYTHNLPVSTGKSSQEAGQELIYHAILSLGNEIKMLRDLIVANLPDENDEDQESSSAFSRGMTVEQMEKIMVRRVLAETNGNRKEAAKKLGIGERTLYRKLKKYGIS